jgi:hypothetical protein
MEGMRMPDISVINIVPYALVCEFRHVIVLL